eukprot:g7244.t1
MLRKRMAQQKSQNSIRFHQPQKHVALEKKMDHQFFLEAASDLSWKMQLFRGYEKRRHSQQRAGGSPVSIANSSVNSSSGSFSSSKGSFSSSEGGNSSFERPVTPGKTVSALCASVWDGGWCKIRFKEEAGIIRAVGTVTKKNGQDEWDIKFPFADSPVDHTIYEFLLRIEDPLQVQAGTFIYDDKQVYNRPNEKKADVNETDSKVKTPVRKGVNFKTNSDRIRQILSAATLNDETKVLQVADTLKAMYPAASMHALIREHFDHYSGYVAQGSTVPLKASAMASALVMRHSSWDAIIEAETGSKPSNPKPSNGGDPFNEALAQENSDLQGEVARLRNQKEQLERSAKRLKTNDGGLRGIQLHLDEDDEIQQEQSGTSGLRHALAKLADDEADRAKILDKYGLRTIPEVHLCDTKTLRRIMKGYGVSVTELLPAKGVAECGQETRTSAKGAMTSELFSRLLRALCRITGAIHTQHKDDVMEHWQEVIDYLPTHTLQSVMKWSFSVRCQVPMGEWARGHKSLRLGALMLVRTPNQNQNQKSGDKPKPQSGKDATCKQWGLGHCTWGPKCRFQHVCPVCPGVEHVKAGCPKKNQWPF